MPHYGERRCQVFPYITVRCPIKRTARLILYIKLLDIAIERDLASERSAKSLFRSSIKVSNNYNFSFVLMHRRTLLSQTSQTAKVAQRPIRGRDNEPRILLMPAIIKRDIDYR
jgi:hypothetical protein